MSLMPKCIALIVSLFLLLSSPIAYAEDRSFEIREVDIHARIDSDGSMHVTERDTYHFNGSFQGILVDLQTTGSDGIEHFQAFEMSGEQQIPLHFEKIGDGETLQYKIYTPSADETKVFQIMYSLKNVVQVYADTAELYWKFFDSTNQSNLEKVGIDIELPNDIRQESIVAFGHGPLHGTHNINNNGIVRYQISPLPANEMLEVRILFPNGSVPGSTKVSDAMMYDQIIEEEENWSYYMGMASVYGALALLIANVVAGIILQYKFGNRSRSKWKGKYYREIPNDVTPAVVSYLMRERTKPRDLMATMVDLARKQYVSMKEIKNGSKPKESHYSFQLIKSSTSDLQPHEKKLLDWFFHQLGNNESVSMAQIQKHIEVQSNAAEFLKNWSEFKEEVAEAAVRLGYIQHQKWVPRAVILIFIVQFFGFWFVAHTDWTWLMFCAPFLLFFKPGKRRRTPLGQTEYVKWKAFKRFLRDYSRMSTREPLEVHLWQHYFVYAIPLNEAKRMKEIGHLKMPVTRSNESIFFDSSFAHSYNSWDDKFEHTISQAYKCANPSDSSSDSGGSFSSGGGGGGGGGGRGAF
ncbi:DUF2207 domain-containing protein [Paenibacillus eucommiae]|uniref:Membrane protein n=1 Tax=Paenibacillus eucommiae TaxID=1355755 RepID=A0ABS4IYN2_9BACL|nr:DUF2207 domain-containing protein [Paenibacillus eucommiae]MBP1991649.1 putative membrane protein [Paenibacillus eucommiae]